MSKQIHREGQRKKQVKIRADENLVDAFDEWCDEQDTSRSEAIRSLMQSRVEGGVDYETPRQPPTDDDQLATAYRRLCAVANDDGIIRGATAESVLASVLGIQKPEVRPRALKPLEKRGYISRTANIYGAESYRVR